MAVSTRTLSLTRPSAPEKEYTSSVWQFNAGVIAAVVRATLNSETLRLGRPKVNEGG